MMKKIESENPFMNIAILIPAFEPDEKLKELCAQLGTAFPLIVVDDGSGVAYADLFSSLEDMGITVLHHEKNLGKGEALKTGIRHLSLQEDIDGIITADADGQHTVSDITSIARYMESYPDTLIIGGRNFVAMPARSRFGNTVSCFFFRLCTGLKISDTQSGLRGLPASLFDKLLAVPGSRYEYEMNMLLAIKEWGCPYKELPIDTVYIEGNRSSHFHALRDGMLVFSRVIKYALSSLCSTAVDYLAYILLLMICPAGWSYVFARIGSASLNYLLNCKMVFNGKVCFKSFAGYALLALFSMTAGAVSVSALTRLGLGSVWAKLIIDVALFTLNYYVQKRIVFRRAAKISQV